MDGCALGLGPVSVGGTFDVPSAHLAPDEAGVGSLPPRGQCGVEEFGDRALGGAGLRDAAILNPEGSSQSSPNEQAAEPVFHRSQPATGGVSAPQFSDAVPYTLGGSWHR